MRQSTSWQGPLIAGKGEGHPVRGWRNAPGLFQRCLEEVVLSHAGFKMVTGQIHAFPAPAGCPSTEVVANPHHAVTACDDAQPGGGIVLAPRRDAMAALGAKVVKASLMPPPGRRREDPKNLGVTLAGGGAPALKEHLMDGRGGEDVPFQGERAVSKPTEAAARLVSIGMESIPEKECVDEDVQVAKGRLGISHVRRNADIQEKEYPHHELVPRRSYCSRLALMISRSRSPPSIVTRLNGYSPMRLERWR